MIERDDNSSLDSLVYDIVNGREKYQSFRLNLSYFQIKANDHTGPLPFHANDYNHHAGGDVVVTDDHGQVSNYRAVSYTHLTLPTICSV